MASLSGALAVSFKTISLLPLVFVVALAVVGRSVTRQVSFSRAVGPPETAPMASGSAGVTSEAEPEEPAPAPSDDRASMVAAPRAASALLSRSAIPTRFGVVLVGVGFGLLAYTWSMVANTLDVAAQLTYIVSGGLTGLGVILVGLTVIVLTSRRRERSERDRSMLELRDTLKELTDALDRLAPGE
jgi:hypothetical protein